MNGKKIDFTILDEAQQQTLQDKCNLKSFKQINQELVIQKEMEKFTNSHDGPTFTTWAEKKDLEKYVDYIIAFYSTMGVRTETKEKEFLLKCLDAVRQECTSEVISEYKKTIEELENNTDELISDLQGWEIENETSQNTITELEKRINLLETKNTMLQASNNRLLLLLEANQDYDYLP